MSAAARNPIVEAPAEGGDEGVRIVGEIRDAKTILLLYHARVAGIL